MNRTQLLATSLFAIAAFSLTGCSETREESVEDSALTQAEAPPEVDAITNEPDGELGVAASGEQTAGEPSVVDPPEDIAMNSEAEPANSFAALDENSDGYVGRDEASRREELTQQWEQLDQNGDQQLDATEFSKFETD